MMRIVVIVFATVLGLAYILSIIAVGLSPWWMKRQARWAPPAAEQPWSDLAAYYDADYPRTGAQRAWCAEDRHAPCLERQAEVERGRRILWRDGRRAALAHTIAALHECSPSRWGGVGPQATRALVRCRGAAVALGEFRCPWADHLIRQHLRHDPSIVEGLYRLTDGHPWLESRPQPEPWMELVSGAAAR